VSAHGLRDLLDGLVVEMVRSGITLDEGRQAFEARFIQHALDRTDGHAGHAAQQLGIHRNTLARKIAEYGLRPKS
jgi:DNA-binding NtrC family response regulator